jgi:hypothetical protein
MPRKTHLRVVEDIEAVAAHIIPVATIPPLVGVEVAGVVVVSLRCPVDWSSTKYQLCQGYISNVARHAKYT